VKWVKVALILPTKIYVRQWYNMLGRRKARTDDLNMARDMVSETGRRANEVMG
jgi:hypothetical protein